MNEGVLDLVTGSVSVETFDHFVINERYSHLME